MGDEPIEEVFFLICKICKWPTVEFGRTLADAHYHDCRKCERRLFEQRGYSVNEWARASCDHPKLHRRLETRGAEYIEQCMDCGACRAGGNDLGRN